jgi:TonB-linked SusC/RagA family outer membrane protein
MRKNLLVKMLPLFLMLITSMAWGQERTVTGKVTSADDGTGLPGVNVLIKGTTNGTVTDAEGKYSISAPANSTFAFSFIGYLTQDVNIGERTAIDVQLVADVTQLSEIVVTAQGIDKDKKSIGYAIQTVKGGDLAQRSETNLLNTLQGKLAGVNISSASGGAGSSTNINIRGVTSLGGNNQPLIVVDGIIFNNDVNNTQNTLFGSQPSNRLNDISPENIESINVLKGPGASVLYGSRAGSGVIVITTKKGSKVAGKTEVTLTSSLNFQDVYGLPKFQNQYGQGINNDFNNTQQNSWGPAFGGALSEVTTAQGIKVPYQAYPDNVSGFFKQGKIFQNGANLSSGDKDKNVSLSISSTTQDGIIPASGYTRNSVQFGGNTKLDNGLKIGSSITYVQSTQRGVTGGNGGSALGQMTRIPRSYNLTGDPFEDPITGKSIYYNTNQNHPLWSTKNETFKSTVDRAFGLFSLGYDIKPWLNVTYRATGDVYFDRRKQALAIGSARSPTGNITENAILNSELNGDLMIRASKDNIFIEGLTASILLGQNINQRKFQNIQADVTTLSIIGFNNISGGGVFTGSSETNNTRRLLGHYADLSLSYKNYLFVTLQGRVDRSSTLPKSNNTFFYPGVSVSFVPTDAFGIKSSILSELKVRGSIAKVGKDANPYLLTPTLYGPATYGNNVANITFPITVGGSIPGFAPLANIGNQNLTPEFTTSYDGGVNFGLFNHRLTMDVGYFYSESSNGIFNVSVSNSSGFDTRTDNVGLITNRGWEVELSATPVRKGSFTWEISGNWSRLRNQVVRITEGITSSNIPGNGFIGISPSIKEGSPYGVIIGTDFAQNPAGQRLINPNTGLYQPGVPNSVIANPNPEWTAGLTNTFSYKNLTLSALIDVRYGGDLYSFGWVDLRQNGSLEITAADRDKPRVFEGVIDVNGDGSLYIPNNIQISAQSYWQNLGGLASKSAVFNATTYRLREMSLTYQLPKNLLSKTPLGGVSIGVSGRNLFYYAPYAPGDPGVNTQGAGNIQGLDLNGAPPTRNYGFNIRVTL